MMLPRTRQTGFHRVLTLLAFVPACVWFSAPVQAGCAHPAGASRNGMSDYRLDSLRIFEIGGLFSRTETRPIETPWSAPADRPCSGPNCKRNSTPSQVPSPIPFLLRIDGCLSASRLDRAPQCASALLPVEPVLSRIDAANSLERPPRPSAS
ncbi:MAG: hypothetical protein P4L85_20230 [Paludisphaera borealis]|uniref:hypothetical protein n=1 Tax=Paludisphaera borealis TaxID=1387353 RepID=UPI002848DF6A|nr:hypothetical protein [Paludisphaera borealis]MDR3621691.1 hypothetical protein [Paludisphaera borealis]